MRYYSVLSNNYSLPYVLLLDNELFSNTNIIAVQLAFISMGVQASTLELYDKRQEYVCTLLFPPALEKLPQDVITQKINLRYANTVNKNRKNRERN